MIIEICIVNLNHLLNWPNQILIHMYCYYKRTFILVHNETFETKLLVTYFRDMIIFNSAVALE